jgi:hypothetical protein
MKDAIEQTGAVLMGRRTFEMADPDSYVGNYELQVPIFVLTHPPPRVAPKPDEHLTFTPAVWNQPSPKQQLPHAIRQFRGWAASTPPNRSWMRGSSTSFMLISCWYF